MQSKSVAFQLVEALRDLGVKHVFGVPSGGWVDYMEALRQTDGIEFILATHEGGAAMMAATCGRITGIPGVCFGTFGPGATNLTTGVGAAQLDRAPLIALSDEIPDAMRHRVTQMNIDHQALFRPLTKHTTRLRAERVRETIFEAATIALSDRPGAVHIGLPAGMSAEVTPASTLAFKVPEPTPAADPETLEALALTIKSHKQPVIALGLGAVRADVRTEIVELAETLNAPVVLTPMAKGMIGEDHPNYAGVLFHALSDMVGETHGNADLIIAIGYDPVEFNYEAWAVQAPIVNIDTQPIDIDPTSYPQTIDVIGDIATSVRYLTQQSFSKSAWNLDEVAARRDAMFAKMSPFSNTFGPCAALDVIRDVLVQDGTMSCDVGAHIHLIGQKWPTPEPGLQIMTNGWSTMGYGIPAAIAAKLCRPEKPVCTVVGDGGFLMTVGELATAVRHDIPFVTIVLTDNDLALIRIKQEKKGNPIYGTPVRSSGTIGGDNLFGVPVLSTDTAEGLRTALETAFAADGPMVVEAIVDSREYDDLVLRNDKASFV